MRGVSKMNFQIIVEELQTTNLYTNILASLKNVLVGFSAAFIIAIILAFLLYEFKVLDKIVYPIIELLRPIPNAGWVPVAIIMCATMEQSILFITFVGAFFPMFLNIYRSLDNIPVNYLSIAKLYKLNRKEKYIKIIIPSILPNIFTAMMLGISGAWLSVIMAEMISGKVGLGYYTWKNYTLLCYEKVFLGIVLMGLLGACFSLIIATISKKTLHWVRNGE